MADSKLKLIVCDNAENLGVDVNRCLNEIRDTKTDYRVEVDHVRFANGEGKAVLKDTVRDSDVYILSDVGNYGMKYKFFGKNHYMTPDEHHQDIKRVISAVSNHANKVNLITPLLYESRQDKKNGRESLDCSMSIQELVNLNVRSLITFDAHNPSAAENASPLFSFENLYPTYNIIEEVYKKNPNEFKNLLILAPDSGALKRARYYRSIIECELGYFDKVRDYSNVVDGKNPILEHKYMGPSLYGKNIMIVDDMIASGGSVLDVCEQAKAMGANKIFICTTFALFTEGKNIFDLAYEQGLFDGVYSTNLSYVPTSIKRRPWFNSVNCSRIIAEVVDNLNKGESIESFFKPNEDYKKLQLLKNSKSHM